MNNILILKDKRGYVAGSKTKGKKCMLDAEMLKKNFLEMNEGEVEIKSIHELRFPTKYDGWWVIYPSSEDPGLFYKDYIEDILLRLRMDGAILLPKFELFRAHHNKVFMELYRTTMTEEFNTIESECFYGLDDFAKNVAGNIKFPLVLKTAAGSGSAGVSIAGDMKSAESKIQAMSKQLYYDHENSRKKKLRHFFGKIRMNIFKQEYIDPPVMKKKMLAQTYIQGLDCDYKVLVFGEKYYMLRRGVRENDFRASGSGKFEFPDKLGTLEEKVLGYAARAYELIDTPLLSIDIAYDGKECHMLEFQCVNFGPYTLQYSKSYFSRDENGVWMKHTGESNLEKEMATAILRYINLEEFKPKSMEMQMEE